MGAGEEECNPLEEEDPLEEGLARIRGSVHGPYPDFPEVVLSSEPRALHMLSSHSRWSRAAGPPPAFP